MYLKDEDIYQNLMYLERIKKAQVGTSSFVHSLYIYNNYEKTYYSTINPVVHNDEYLNDIIKSYDKIPVLKPIMRKIETVESSGVTSTSNVLTYFYYELTDSENRMDGAVVVNVKTDWLFNSVRDINSMGGKNSDSIFIMDQNGEFINNSNSSSDFCNSLKTNFSAYMQNNGISTASKERGSYYQKINGEKYFVAYINLEKEGWTIFKVRLYRDISSSLSAIQIIIFLTAGLFLFLALFLSFYITGRIYKPVEAILNDLKGAGHVNDWENTNKLDEISFIRETIKGSYKELDRYIAERDNSKHIMKSYFLRSLLLESKTLKEEDFVSSCSENQMDMKEDGDYYVCVIKLDRYQELKARHADSDIELFKLAVCDMVSSHLSSSYVNEAVSMNENQVAIIITSSENQTEFCNKAGRQLEHSRSKTMEMFGFSFTAALSEPFRGFRSISRCYNSALDVLTYRFVLGYCSVIISDSVSRNISTKAFEGFF